MYKSTHQLDLFYNPSLNVTYEIKRQMRLVVAASPLSRDQITDKMNAVAAREGMRANISKAIFDNWLKDSDPGRMPSVVWLTIFCEVMATFEPVAAMVRPLGGRVIGPEEVRALRWAQAEMEKRRATKRARMALEAIE